MARVEGTIDTQLSAEGEWLSITQVCRATQIDSALVVELVELGLVTRRGEAPQEWLLPARDLKRLQTAARLIRDLDVNVSGAALAVELLEARRELEARLRALERYIQLSAGPD